MRCVMCGRALVNASVFVAGRPVGPVCAKRAGLVERAPSKQSAALRIGRVRLHAVRREDAATLDLFDGAASV